MNDKKMMMCKIWQLDFALHELVLYLDSHPDCERALALMRDYRKLRRQALKEYNERFGELIITPKDAGTESPWQWIKGPWPWENNFAEGK